MRDAESCPFRIPACRAAALLCMALFAAFASACDTERTCTLIAKSGLTITVIDSATGNAICDAIVTLHDGAYTETLSARGCVYDGAIERRGTYTIDVVSGSRSATATATATVTADDCHVMTKAVTIAVGA